jgi:hypothetical protein
MNFIDKEKSYDDGFTDGGRYVLAILVNQHDYQIPYHLDIWKDFFESKPGIMPISAIIDRERKRILDELERIEQKSNATRTPLYQETLIQLIRDRITNGQDGKPTR